MTVALSVIVPTHQPHPARLARTLAALRAQTLAAEDWETLVIDNASCPPLEATRWKQSGPPNLRVVPEPTLGLTAARLRGLAEARGALVVFADDDNVLAPNYLARVVHLFSDQPRLGACGGKCIPEFESKPPEWTQEFLPLLALRDGGDQPCVADGLRSPGASRNRYPDLAAPLGAGMAARREALAAWHDEHGDTSHLPDRRGRELSSGGDNDMVFSILKSGWTVGYFPELSLTHLIPPERLTHGYLGRLNRGIQFSWVTVLRKYHACPWPSIPPWTLPLRQLKAWFTHGAWRGGPAYIRWQGSCGRLAGQASKLPVGAAETPSRR